MRFQYLGTAAGEGWPAIFCSCEYCRKAEELGGKNIRTRSQALVNGDLLLDLPPDTFHHKLMHKLDLGAVKYLFITHLHTDHFLPQDLLLRGSVYAHDMKSPHLQIYCSQETKSLFDASAAPLLDEPVAELLHWHVLEPFQTVEAGPYTVTALPASHMVKGVNQPFMYHIVDEEGVSLYYLHDSGYYLPEVWQYFKDQVKAGKPADFISIDGTNGRLTFEPVLEKVWGHLGVGEVLKIIEMMRGFGFIDEKTQCCIHHFSHNGALLHEELEARLNPAGIQVSYDGKVVELPPRK